MRRYVMLILPLIIVLREGLEAVVYVGGVELGLPLLPSLWLLHAILLQVF